MKKNNISPIYIVTILIALIIICVFSIRTLKDGLGVYFELPVDYALTGQLGDFIGGVLGTLFSAAGFYFLFITLQDQRNSFEKERFESKFYELLRLHKENVSELEYTKFDDLQKELVLHRNRTVFALFFEEFLECYKELLSFNKMMGQPKFLNEKYELKLKNIIEKNKLDVTPLQIAQIDIAYCIVFYGVTIQSEPVLNHLFRKKVNNNYYFKLIKYFQLKCRKENSFGYKEWIDFYEMPKEDRLNLFDEIYDSRRTFEFDSDEVIQTIGNSLIENFNASKYYSGYHNSIGHYFRHLFQTYKFIDEQKNINDEEKYYFGKSLRAQLSTFEQAILFFNSISSLGRRWELEKEVKPTKPILGGWFKKEKKELGLITKYQLVKNLPGTHFYKIRYKRFYPNIKYESYENQL